MTVPGAEYLITSDEVLSEREQPGSVISIGGGVISLESAHIYARASTDVMILEALPQLLPAMDADAVAQLQAESERIGIRVRTGVDVTRIEPANGRLRVIFTHDGTEHAAEADRMVNGAGRIANVDPGRACQWPRGGRSLSSFHLEPESSAATPCRSRRSCRRLRPTRATSLAATLSRDLNKVPPTRAWRPRSIRFQHSPRWTHGGRRAAEGIFDRGSCQRHAQAGFPPGPTPKPSHGRKSSWIEPTTASSARILSGMKATNFGLAIKFGITARQLRDNVYAHPTFSAVIKHMFAHA